jgi:hypothetical protein
MARKLLKDTCTIAAEILDGQHDDDLDYIAQACKARLKARFRKGQRVVLRGTRNVELDGKEATILKVNAKTISVGVGEPKVEFGYTFYSDGEFNVPPALLEAASA